MKLKYAKEVIELGKDNKGKSIYEIRYDYVKVETGFVRRYHNCLYLLLQLPQGERALMDYLTEVMDSDNLVYNNELNRSKFIELYNEANKEHKSYQIDSVRIWFQRLANKNLILPINRGTYKVNPEYFFKGDDKSRLDSIKLMLEFKAGVDTKINVNK